MAGDYTNAEFRTKCKMTNNSSKYPSIDYKSIARDGLEKLLANLNPAKVPGPDGI